MKRQSLRPARILAISSAAATVAFAASVCAHPQQIGARDIPPPGGLIAAGNGNTSPPAPAALAALPTAPAPAPDQRFMRLQLGFTAAMGGLFSSPFSRLAAQWGYRRGFFAGTLATDLGYHFNQYFMLGARVGYVGASTDNARFDRRHIDVNMVDAGGVLRVSLPLGGTRRRGTQVAGQFEAGVAFASLSLRGDAQNSPALLRLGGQLMFLAHWEHVGFGLRIGYQNARWADAGGRGVDLGLSGLTAGASVEVGL